jgi:hypothetical protein
MRSRCALANGSGRNRCGTARRPVALRQYAVRLLLTSDQYEYQAQPGVFPLGQLAGTELSGRSGGNAALFRSCQMEERRRRSVAGRFYDRLRSREPHFHPRQHQSADRRARSGRHSAGRQLKSANVRLGTGRVVEIDDRKVTIGGQYVLGTGFMGFGVALTSTANFARLFPQRAAGRSSAAAADRSRRAGATKSPRSITGNSRPLEIPRRRKRASVGGIGSRLYSTMPRRRSTTL